MIAHYSRSEAPYPQPEAQAPTRMTTIEGAKSYVYAPDAGILEPASDLGDTVEEGQIAGYVHFLDDPGRSPAAAEFKKSGMLFCRRAPGKVIRGNCVGIIVNDYPG